MKNKSFLLIAVLVIVGAFLYGYYGTTDPSINKITTVEVNSREDAFQNSQQLNADTSLDSIEEDLNNTIIQPEDFSDIE